MSKEKLKRFLITEAIINSITLAVIFLSSYIMRDCVWWKMTLLYIAVLLINMAAGAINIVCHIKD